ncbi:MAG: UDP-glucose 4-epimerase [Desulfobacteraceae bacterium Eth-SRB2]|nr:MAG: UDP-glucose 4-epimerase [Desulfobacteraceae bacterium Eth-SRB2]
MKDSISKTSDKPTRWLITGGCGFIGTSLIKNLVSEGGHTIRVLDNLSVGTRQDLSRVCTFSEKGKVKSEKSENPSSLLTSNSSLTELIVGDITDYETCLNWCQEIDIIVHLAANTGVGPSVEDPRKDMESNVIGTFNMLEAARNNGVKRFVFASSGAPVGECEPPIHEELAPHPVSPYGASKLAGEGYCSAYYRTFGLETVALRFGNVYGPGSSNKNSVVARFIKQSMNGEALEIYGDGLQTRDFIYIDDLIAAIYNAATLDPLFLAGETFQIATNSETTVCELSKILVNILNAKGVASVEIVHAEQRKGDVLRNYSDTTKAEAKLGWNAETKLETGIRKTVEWFLAGQRENRNRM